MTNWTAHGNKLLPFQGLPFMAVWLACPAARQACRVRLTGWNASDIGTLSLKQKGYRGDRQQENVQTDAAFRQGKPYPNSLSKWRFCQNPDGFHAAGNGRFQRSRILAADIIACQKKTAFVQKRTRPGQTGKTFERGSLFGNHTRPEGCFKFGAS